MYSIGLIGVMRDTKKSTFFFHPCIFFHYFFFIMLFAFSSVQIFHFCVFVGIFLLWLFNLHTG